MSNTLQIGKVYYQFDEIQSTNDYARVLLSKSPRPPEGTVVRANFQTAGRGQMGNQWHSEAGCNFLGSIIFYPHFLPIGESFLLNQFTSLAVFDTLRHFLPSAFLQVKWPNDVLLHHQKVAGILIQNSISQAKFDSTIVGIGLNINQLYFPPHLSNATSMRLNNCQQLFDVEKVMAVLFEKLATRYNQTCESSSQKLMLKRDYLEQLKGFGMPMLFRRIQNNAQFQGVIQDVLENGQLLVKILDKNETNFEKFNFKEIEFLN